MFTHIKRLKYCASVLIPHTCTLMYYLKEITNLRRITNCHAVILDQDNCIRVL